MSARNAVVYWSEDRNGDSLYVGCSGNFWFRYIQHRSNPAAAIWFRQAIRWYRTGPAPRHLALLMERVAIRNKLPRFNTYHHPTAAPRASVAELDGTLSALDPDSLLTMAFAFADARELTDLAAPYIRSAA
jgi:hypothetical protein